MMDDLYLFDGGVSLGRIRSESGVIERDDEHPLGARITMERRRLRRGRGG